ncbi:DUF6364 family protein [Flavobacterium sp. DGU11]|uniref:DUF6364 family protein n=1 Tax=Flavobacterium arundinis TaxID=3139143 RepID=A0ABU9HYQ9_9FLAO
MSKLTLNIDESLIAKAKVYAAKQNRSLSSVIESLLGAVLTKERIPSNDITPFVRSMATERSLPADEGKTDEYFEYMLRKHQ